MDVVVCENGHHFDRDSYQDCPVCGAPQGYEIGKCVASEQMPKRKIFGKKGAKGNEIVEKTDENTTGKYVNTPSKAEMKNKDVDTDVTVSGDEQENSPEDTSAGPLRDIAEEIEKVKQDKEKTLGVFRTINSSVSGSASSEAASQGAIFPVGWLVCVKGINFGKTYPIYEGQNTIGRDSKYVIALEGDNYVSASNIHAKLIYEPNTRKFIIMGGDSRSLAYLNEEPVLMPEELNIYDKISFGDINKNAYMLFPLCSENFSWTDFNGD